MKSHLYQIKNWPERARAANWSSPKLAKKCGVSMRALQRHFAKEFGQTPRKWLKEERLRQAKALLADVSMVKEVADSSGYTHAQHFTRDFKKLFGYCPTKMLQPVDPPNAPRAEI